MLEDIKERGLCWCWHRIERSQKRQSRRVTRSFVKAKMEARKSFEKGSVWSEQPPEEEDLKSVRSRKASATVQEAILDDLVRAENQRTGQNFDRLHPKARVQVASRPKKAEADSTQQLLERP